MDKKKSETSKLSIVINNPLTKKRTFKSGEISNKSIKP